MEDLVIDIGCEENFNVFINFIRETVICNTNLNKNYSNFKINVNSRQRLKSILNTFYVNNVLKSK